MAEDVAAIGIKVDTDGVERGIKSLDQLIGVGPKVEQAMGKVEAGAKKAGQSLRNIDGGESSRELEKAAASATRLGGALNAISAGGAVVAVRAVTGVAKNLFQELYQTSAQLERFKIGLDFASGGSGAAELHYLRTVTKALGLEMASTTQAYMGFQAASKGTALEGEKAKKIFESISKAAAVMGLSSEQSSGALLALQQMVSKGTVQAEELRGQLGERLPGAFQIAAKAMGVTTAELGKMLEQGQVVAEDFLPKFADALNKHLGDAAEKAANRLDAATNRYTSAMDRMKSNLGDSGASEFWSGQLNILTDALDDVSISMERARKDGDGFTGQMLSAAGAVMRFLNPLNAVSYQAQDAAAQLNQAEKALADLVARGAQSSSNLMLREAYNHAQRLVNKLREAKAAQDALTGNQAAPGGINPGDFPTRGSQANYLREREAASNKLLAISARENGITKQFTDDLNAYAEGLRTGAISADEYVKAITKLNTEREKALRKKDGSNKGDREGERLSAALNKSVISQIQGSLRDMSSTYSVAESVMEARRQAGLLSEKEYYDAKRSFIELNKQAQISALAEENAALAKQQLSAAEAVARDQKIAENKSRITQIAMEAAGKLETLDIQQAASARQHESALLAARQAADEYIDSIERANAASVAGVGRGDRWRSDESGRLSVMDRFADQRRTLANQRAQQELAGPLSAEAVAQYEKNLAILAEAEQKALAAYQGGIAGRIAAEGNWANGATSALENYRDSAANVAGQVSEMFTRAFQGMEDGLVNFVKTGKLDFKSLADSIITDLIRIQIRSAMSGLLSGGFSGLFGGGRTILPPGDGFASGGYTGNGGKYEPAGIVHRGEYVINAESTKKLGLAYLNSLNGYAKGGYVGGGAPVAAPAGGKSVGDVYVTVQESSTQTKGGGQMGADLGNRIGNAVRAVLVQEKMPGGLLHG